MEVLEPTTREVCEGGPRNKYAKDPAYQVKFKVSLTSMPKCDETENSRNENM